MTSIKTFDEIKKMAQTRSKFSISDTVADEVSKTIDFVHDLGQANVVSVPAILIPLEKLADDTPHPSFPINKTLLNAGKNKKERYFVVPLTVE